MSDALEAALEFVRTSGRDDPQLPVRLTLWTGTVVEGTLKAGAEPGETVALRVESVLANGVRQPSRVWINRSGIVAVEVLAAPPPAKVEDRRAPGVKEFADRVRSLLQRRQPRT